MESLDTELHACKETRSSKKFQKLLEFILAIGNYMNGSTTRGEAWGFKLDSLPKMLDVKSSVDPKVSLLHFVAQEMERFNPEHADLIEDFPHLEAAVRGSS
jgi:dishevelled associated activator of morphogenesis